MDSTSRRGFRLVGRMMNFAFVMTIAAGGVFFLLEPPSNQVCVLFAEDVTFSQVQPESDATPSGARDKNFIGSLRDLIQGSEVFESSDSQQGLFQILDEADGLLADAKAKNQDALRNVNRQVRVGAASLAPNFILVQMERVGFSDWGCYGGTSTPTIDKLADDGVRFTNFYAGGSDPEKSLWCLTTSAHGGHVPGSRTTRNLYDAMWLGGYATAFIGLWKQSGSPLDIGAEEFVGFLSKTPVSSFPEEVAVDRATLRILANRGESKKFSCDQLLANEVKTYLDRARRTPRQFFLHVVLPSQASFQNGPKGRAPTDIRTDDAQRLDQFMASLLQALEQTGLAHRSVILLTGLSGIPPESDGAQNSEWSSKTHGLAEGNLRLPFIIRSPRRFPVKESPALAAMWDLYPTLLEWGVVQRRVPGMNGASLIPLLRGEEKSRQELLYWRTDDGAAQAVRREEWKAVYLATEKSLRLYNLSQDPGETTNVAQEHPKVVERMLAK